MRKFKIFCDYEKEEQYLKEMALRGYIFEKRSVFSFYHFKKVQQPQKLNYRIDCKKFSNRNSYNDYVSLFEDAGWKHISGGYYSRTQYFLPINDTAGDKIFSDVESAAQRTKNLKEISGVNFIILLIDLLICYKFGQSYWSTFGFLTPGLWQMKGTEFLTAFLFEFPFAFCRIALPLILLILTVLYGVMSCKATKIYNNKIKNAK